MNCDLCIKNRLCNYFIGPYLLVQFIYVHLPRGKVSYHEFILVSSAVCTSLFYLARFIFHFCIGLYLLYDLRICFKIKFILIDYLNFGVYLLFVILLPLIESVIFRTVPPWYYFIECLKFTFRVVCTSFFISGGNF